MKKVAIYPGSFNPWHEGHTDVVLKALQVFDELVIAIGMNPEKDQSALFGDVEDALDSVRIPKGTDLRVVAFNGFLIDEIVDYSKHYPNKICAIVRGLRNGQDLENERSQQFWNEDLAKESSIILPPTFYIVTDRSLVHISSSAYRMVNKLKGRK